MQATYQTIRAYWTDALVLYSKSVNLSTLESSHYSLLRFGIALSFSSACLATSFTVRHSLSHCGYCCQCQRLGRLHPVLASRGKGLVYPHLTLASPWPQAWPLPRRLCTFSPALTFGLPPKTKSPQVTHWRAWNCVLQFSLLLQVAAADTVPTFKQPFHGPVPAMAFHARPCRMIIAVTYRLPGKETSMLVWTVALNDH